MADDQLKEVYAHLNAQKDGLHAVETQVVAQSGKIDNLITASNRSEKAISAAAKSLNDHEVKCERRHKEHYVQRGDIHTRVTKLEAWRMYLAASIVTLGGIVGLIIGLWTLAKFFAGS